MDSCDPASTAQGAPYRPLQVHSSRLPPQPPAPASQPAAHAFAALVPQPFYQQQQQQQERQPPGFVDSAGGGGAGGGGGGGWHAQQQGSRSQTDGWGQPQQAASQERWGGQQQQQQPHRPQLNVATWREQPPPQRWGGASGGDAGCGGSGGGWREQPRAGGGGGGSGGRYNSPGGYGGGGSRSAYAGGGARGPSPFARGGSPGGRGAAPPPWVKQPGGWLEPPPGSFEEARFRQARAQARRPAAAAAPGAERLVVVMRGLPGSGKSTRAAELAAAARRTAGLCSAAELAAPPDGADGVAAVHSTDSYFVDAATGAYTFDPELLPANHARNLDAFCASLEAGVSLVVVDNTNLQPWQYEKYVAAAWAAGCRVREEVVGEFTEAAAALYAQRNTHGVPHDKLLVMLEQWRQQ